jgi:hypothetical protein
MIMQWFVNEVRAKFAEIDKRFQSILGKPVIPENDERITKLEGEIRAMKARMGKKQD